MLLYEMTVSVEKNLLGYREKNCIVLYSFMFTVRLGLSSDSLSWGVRVRIR